LTDSEGGGSDEGGFQSDASSVGTVPNQMEFASIRLVSSPSAKEVKKTKP
jgi:hypothetical protein